MDYWNYRVIKSVNEFGDDEYQICEVYYLNDVISAWSAPLNPYGNTPDELEEVLEMYAQALRKPILQEVDLQLVEIEE